MLKIPKILIFHRTYVSVFFKNSCSSKTKDMLLQSSHKILFQPIIQDCILQGTTEKPLNTTIALFNWVIGIKEAFLKSHLYQVTWYIENNFLHVSRGCYQLSKIIHNISMQKNREKQNFLCFLICFFYPKKSQQKAQLLTSYKETCLSLIV